MVLVYQKPVFLAIQNVHEYTICFDVYLELCQYSGIQICGLTLWRLCFSLVGIDSHWFGTENVVVRFMVGKMDKLLDFYTR